MILRRATSLLVCTALFGLSQLGCSGACDDAAEQYCAAACKCSESCLIGEATEGMRHGTDFASEEECLDQMSGILCAAEAEDTEYDACALDVADAECVESLDAKILIEPDSCKL
jgi:hypothetical protein